MTNFARLTWVALVALATGCSSGSAAPERQKLGDHSFLAFVDDNGNGTSADDVPRMLRFSDYFAANRPGTRVIMLNAAAGWCGPCQHEAAKLSELSASYADRGAVVLTAVFQKDDASAADENFTRQWADTFQLSIPTLVDSTFFTQTYFDVSALPANLFIDAETAEILTVATGAQPGDDPLGEYHAWLDQYLR